MLLKSACVNRFVFCILYFVFGIILLICFAGRVARSPSISWDWEGHQKIGKV